MIDRIFDLIQSNPGSMLPIVLGIPAMLCGVLIIWIIAACSVKCTREEERARREIAAYVAEGTMATEEAERLIRAGRAPEKCA